MEFEEQIISYSQAKNGIDLKRDSFGIGKYCLLPSLKKTFLSNPNLKDWNDTMMIWERMDGDINGRVMFFPSVVKKDEEMVAAIGGSSLFVSEAGRKYMLGSSMVMYPIMNPKSRVLLYGAMTQQAIALYKKLKFTIFDIPQFWQIRNAKPILMRLGLKWAFLTALSGIANIFIRLFIQGGNAIANTKTKRYRVIQLYETPDWIEQIILSDAHKYSEHHSKEWFDWVLNNNFFESEKNKKSLYGIYYNDNPCGFILLSEQDTDLKEAGVGNVVFGYVLEWGISDEKLISESDIFKIAISRFSKSVDVVSVFCMNSKVQRFLKKYGFLRHGNYNMAFKDLDKALDKDSKEIINWRIRTCSDSPFY